MINKSEYQDLFWSDQKMFDKRKSVILNYLEKLDNNPYLHFNITYNFGFLPKDFDETDKRLIQEIFVNEPERFEGPGRLFVIHSRNKNFLVGTGEEGLSFTREDIYNLEYSLTNDYVSQLVLHFVLECDV